MHARYVHSYCISRLVVHVLWKYSFPLVYIEHQKPTTTQLSYSKWMLNRRGILLFPKYMDNPPEKYSTSINMFMYTYYSDKPHLYHNTYSVVATLLDSKGVMLHYILVHLTYSRRIRIL